jgi:hypothetical protein
MLTYTWDIESSHLRYPDAIAGPGRQRGRKLSGPAFSY